MVKGAKLIEFCIASMKSINPKVIQHASYLLFNYILCYQGTKKTLVEYLQKAMKAIDDVLSEVEELPALGKGEDVDATNALLLTECRIMYDNIDLCMWIEEDFKLFFSETHKNLEKST